MMYKSRPASPLQGEMLRHGVHHVTNTTVTYFTCHGITRPMFLNGGSKMAPMFRTCCGFLQLHAACKVGNPRLFIKTGLNAGPNRLFRLPALQVREFIGDKSNYDPVASYDLFTRSHEAPVVIY